MKVIGSIIRTLRNNVGMSQERLSELLGIKRPTLSQIENGERKVSVEELLKLSDIFKVSIDFLLGKEKIPNVILPKVKELTKKDIKEIEEKEAIRINVPQKNLEKFKEVLLYILNKVGSKPNIGETVIHKLLYFIDFNFYEKYEEQLIGATYIKNKYGPTPVEFIKVVEAMIKNGDIEKVKSNYFQFPQIKYLPIKRPDLTKLKANEIEIIDDVLNKYSDMTANKIADYSHKDVPWLTTKKGAKIEYESVFYRTIEFSVRKDNGDF